MKIIVETEEQKQKILEQSKYIHDFLISKDDVNGLGKDWIMGLDSDKAGTLMHLYMAPQIIEVTTKQQKAMSKHSIQNDPEIQKWMENERIDYLIKSEAIDFAKFITNDTTFNDFVFMSKELQEEIYQEFKRENRKL